MRHYIRCSCRAATPVLAGMALATGAHSAPVGAFSEVSYRHEFTLNAGIMPAGLDFSLAAVLERSRDAGTFLDRPGTNVIDIPSVQVGEVVTDPPIPYFDRRGIAETTADGTHAARASYNVNILQTNGTGSAPDLAVVSRETDNEGAAEFTSTDGTARGDAASDFFVSRVYGYENENASTISFNLFGVFSAEVLASYSGQNGFARSSLSYNLDMTPDAGVVVSYLPLAPYLRSIDDADPGAEVSEFLDIGADGFAFSAGASAMGTGGAANAHFDGGFRYALRFTMAPGSSFLLTDRFTQTNVVTYLGPDMPPVPLPASALLLLGGLSGLVVTARRRARRPAA